LVNTAFGRSSVRRQQSTGKNRKRGPEKRAQKVARQERSPETMFVEPDSNTAGLPRNIRSGQCTARGGAERPERLSFPRKREPRSGERDGRALALVRPFKFNTSGSPLSRG
jgi:hypothetical protein